MDRISSPCGDLGTCDDVWKEERIKIMSFWVQFAIQEAIVVAQLVVQDSSLSPAQKAALEKFIADGQALLNTFTVRG